MATRNDYLKALNKMRENYQVNGNAIINTTDDSTAVGEELSSFAYMETPLPSMSELSIDEKEVDRSNWQRAMDTGEEFVSDVTKGTLNFLDGIGDALISFGSLFTADDQWAKDAITYDWVAQANEFLNGIANPFNVLSGDVFTEQYWTDLSKASTVEGARELEQARRKGSFVSEASQGFQDTYHTITEAIGYVLPDIVLSVATAGGSKAATTAAKFASVGGHAASAFGGGTEEALNEGAEMGEAAVSGLVSMGIEMGTEALTFGMGKLAGKVLGKATSFGTKVNGIQFAQAISKVSVKELGKTALEEGFEEFVSEILSPFSKIPYKGTEAFKEYSDPQLYKNALNSFISGGVAGVFASGVQSTYSKSHYSSKGVDCINNFSEIIQIKQAAEAEAKKGSNANQKIIQEYETEIGTRVQSFMKDMLELQKDNPKAFERVMRAFQNPNAELSMMERELNKSTYDSLAEAVSEQFSKRKGGKETRIYFGEETYFDSLKEEGNATRAEFRENTDGSIDIAIDPRFKSQFYEIVGHEAISHGLLDTNPRGLDALVKKIESDKELRGKFHEFDSQLEEMYGTDENVLYSERIAKFIERYVKNDSELQRIIGDNTNKSFKTRLKNILIRAKNLLDRSRDGEMIRDIQKAIKRIELYKVTSVLKTKFKKIKGIDNIEEHVVNDYSEIEKRHLDEESNLSQLIFTKSELKNYIEKAIREPKKIKQKAIIGRIKKETALRIKKDIGIDVEGFSLAYDKSHIVHIYKRHVLNESGQIPIDIDDLLKFPYILMNYDQVYISNGKYIFEKDIGNEYGIAIEMSRKRKNLVLNSLFIIKKEENKSLPTVHDSNESLPFTSKTPLRVSSSPRTSSIYEDGENMQEGSKKKFSKIKIDGQTFDTKTDMEGYLDQFDYQLSEIQYRETEYDTFVNKNYIKRICKMAAAVRTYYEGIYDPNYFELDSFSMSSKEFESLKEQMDLRRESVDDVISEIENCDWEDEPDYSDLQMLIEYFDDVDNYFYDHLELVQNRELESEETTTNVVEPIDAEFEEKTLENGENTTYNENDEGGRLDEFRRIQEESRREFTKSREQRIYAKNNEDLQRRLSEIFRRRLDSRGFNSSSNQLLHLNNFDIYENVDGDLFHDIFEIARNYTEYGELVDLHDDYKDSICYLSENGLSGFAITNEGDLISVFNCGSKRGFLYAIKPIVKERAITLDCYVSKFQNLQEMYSKVFGFQTASIMDYNMEYDHDNIAADHNMPQVAFMIQTNRTVELQHFDKDSYDEALSYRNSYKNSTEETKVTSEETKTDSETETLETKEGSRPRTKKVAKEILIPAQLVKDSADLRKQRVYTIKDTKGMVDSLIKDVRELLADNATLKPSSSKTDFIRRTFEEINLSKEVDTAKNSIMEYVLDSKIYIKKSELSEYECTLRELFSEDEIAQLERYVEEMIAANGEQGKVSKLVERYNKYFNTLKKKISELHHMTAVAFKTQRSYEAIRKKIEKSKSMTATGNLNVEAIGMLKDLVPKFTTTQTAYGVSPKVVLELVTRVETYYKKDVFENSLLGYDEDLVGIANALRDSVLTKLDNGYEIQNRELTLEEVELINDYYKRLNAIANRMRSEATQVRIAAVKTSHTITKALKQNAVFKESALGREFRDKTVNAPTFLSLYLGENHPFIKLITKDYIEATGNRTMKRISFEEAFLQSAVESGLFDDSKRNITFKTLARKLAKTKIMFKGYKITLEEALDIYATGKTNEEVFDVGFEFWDKKRNTTKEIKVTKEEFNSFIETIPESYRKWADSVMETLYNGELREYLKERYKTHTGIAIPLLDSYYPTARGKLNNTGIEDMNSNSRGFLTTSGFSFLKKRTGSKSPFSVSGFATRYTSYVGKLSFYGEMTELVDTYRIMMNQKIDGESIHNLLGELIPGWNGKKGWADFTSRVLLEKPLNDWNKDSIFDRILSNSINATLGMNISTMVKQLLGDYAFGLYSGAGAWIVGKFKTLSTFLQQKKIKQILISESGYFNQRFGTNEGSSSITNASTTSIFVKPIEWVDSGIIITHGWAIAQELARREGAGKPWSETNNKRAVKILEEMVLETQNNSFKMNMSKLRSGYGVSYVANKVLGLFGSDNQNKGQYAARAFVGSKFDKERARVFTELSNNMELDEETRAMFAKLATEARVSAKRNKRLGARFVAFLACNAIASSVISSIVKKLKGRESWDEWDEEEMLKNMLFEAFVGWLPIAGNIGNALFNNYDLSLMSLNQINELIDMVNTFTNAANSGDEAKIRAATIKLLSTIAELFGIPVNNIYDLMLGGVNLVSAEKALEINNWTKGYKSSYVKSLYTEAVNKGITSRAVNYLKAWSVMYSINLSDSEVQEIVALEKKGYSVSPKALMREYTSASTGEVIPLTQVEQDSFRKYYSMASEEIQKTIQSSGYMKLTDEQKAKTIKKIYDSYYEFAKLKVIKTYSSTNRIANLLFKSNGRIGLSKYLIGINALSNITATKNKTRKELVLEEINKLKGFSRQEKLLLVYLMGFSVSEENKTSLSQFLTLNGVSSTL